MGCNSTSCSSCGSTRRHSYHSTLAHHRVFCTLQRIRSSGVHALQWRPLSAFTHRSRPVALSLPRRRPANPSRGVRGYTCALCSPQPRRYQTPRGRQHGSSASITTRLPCFLCRCCQVQSSIRTIQTRERTRSATFVPPSHRVSRVSSRMPLASVDPQRRRVARRPRWRRGLGAVASTAMLTSLWRSVTFYCGCFGRM